MAKRSKKQAPSEQYSNKLWQTLRCLKHEEHIRLLRYLRSPYFIMSKTMAPLCEVLIKLIERKEVGFDRPQVWQKIFPDEPYDDVNFRKYCSDLLRLTGEFMAQEMSESDGAKKSIGTLTYAVQHRVEPLLSTALRQARTAVEEKPYRSIDDFLSAYSVERQYYALMEFDVKVNTRANLEEISQQLDLFYWIEKLKLFSSMLSQQRTGNHQYDLKFMGQILEFLRDYPVETVPELAIYYYSFLTLYEEESVSHYYNLRRLLDAYATVMPQKEAIELFDSALHYCTGKINKGDRAFLQEYFDVFAEAIQKGIFLQNGELATWRFNNLVASALGLGKLEWAKDFVEEFKDHLPADSRQNTYSFNLARVYRFQKKYDQVLDLLQNVEYEDIGVNLISKMMLLITHYERNDHEVLNSFIESFRVFLNRHKNIPQPRRISYLNLLKYTRRLMRLAPGDKSAVAKLREEVSREKARIVNHEWLLEKLGEM
ncbi:MAG: hypothetical protein Q7T20_08645 [Saprospiraceae bacterium]|nr:hypothetical protein [Saprospiraceae bacterium]